LQPRNQRNLNIGHLPYPAKQSSHLPARRRGIGRLQIQDKDTRLDKSQQELHMLYMFDPSHLPNRKRPARCPPVDGGNRSVVLFVTVCTKDRKALLANLPAFSLILAAWLDAGAWMVGRFVIMPDHIHLFCSPVDSSYPIRSWITFWKRAISRRWNHADDQPIWQSQMWDTQLRTGDAYDAKWEYVKCNPVRHGLVRRPEEWPFKGELNPLPWHDP